jgi:hypothetical protein
MSFRILTGAALAAVCIAVPPAFAQSQQQRIVGDVQRLDGTTLVVRTSDGSQTLKMPENTRITARLPATWSDVATGSFVGTTAVPQPDGTLLAKEVHIFTEAQRGTGEGHYPMQNPGDTMTNATVSSMSAGPAKPRDTMTNATVAKAGQSGSAHTLKLTYKGGEQTVVVPDGVPLVKSEPGDRALLVPGAHAVVYAHRDADGSMSVDRVSVGKDGFVTPI